jgi:hypothetical protein
MFAAEAAGEVSLAAFIIVGLVAPKFVAVAQDPNSPLISP